MIQQDVVRQEKGFGNLPRPNDSGMSDRLERVHVSVMTSSKRWLVIRFISFHL